MAANNIVSEINQMNWLNRQRYYLKYYTWFYTVNYFDPHPHKRGLVRETKLNYEPIPFEEFCRIPKTVDLGKDWKEQGYAQQSWYKYDINNIFWWILHYRINL